MCRILPYDAAARKSGDFQVFRCSAGCNKWGGRLRNTEFELNLPGFGLAKSLETRYVGTGTSQPGPPGVFRIAQ